MMHYECELAVVIGRSARRVRAEQAYDYISGYTIANDYAVRDYLENYYRPNFRVKNRDQAMPLSPWIVSHDEVGDPMNPATELGPLIHRDHWERVNRYIEIAKQEGADVYAPGVPKGLERGNFVPPTLLLNCRNDMKVAQEEIFGPVMAVMSFTSEEEAIRLANDVKYGLAAYVWTNDMKRGHRVAQAIESGMAWVNSPNVRNLRIPFGGTKYSGIGREGGHYSFDFYTEVQVVHVAVGDPPA